MGAPTNLVVTTTLATRRSVWVTPDGWELSAGQEFHHSDVSNGRRPLAFIAYVDCEEPYIEARFLPWKLAHRQIAQKYHLGNVRTLSIEGVKP